MGLDITDFITEKGGNPEAIKESQRKRFAPVEVVDQVIELYEDHRKSEYRASAGQRIILTECSTVRGYPG